MSACISCGSLSEEVFFLGLQVLANQFSATVEESFGPRYPLGLSECRACGWMQLTEPVPPDLMFKDAYPYRTLVVPQWVTGSAMGERPGFVVEAGSNDGKALREFQKMGWRVLGVDPAHNMVTEARERGVMTWERYFDVDCAKEIVGEHGQADVFFGRHVFAHVPDPGAFLDAVGILLKPDGMAYIEVPSGDAFVNDRLVDTLYHEHRSVITMRAMTGLLARKGFSLEWMRTLDLHGGSMLYEFRKGPTTLTMGDNQEQDRWSRFRADVEANRDAFCQLMLAYRTGNPKRVCGYTAPAKGNVWMQYCEITPKDIPWVADWTPEKIGKFCPGTGIPVVEPLTLEREDVDVAIIFAWNWADQIAASWKHRAQLVRPYGWARPMGSVR